MKDKSFLILSLMLIAVLMLSLMFLVKSETFGKCLETCEAKYKLNIDSSWAACESRCLERFKND